MWKKKRWWFLILVVCIFIWISSQIALEAQKEEVDPFKFYWAILQLEFTDKDFILLSESPKSYKYAVLIDEFSAVLEKKGWIQKNQMGTAFFYQKGNESLMLVRSGWIYDYAIINANKKIRLITKNTSYYPWVAWKIPFFSNFYAKVFYFLFPLYKSY